MVKRSHTWGEEELPVGETIACSFLCHVLQHGLKHFHSFGLVYDTCRNQVVDPCQAEGRTFNITHGAPRVPGRKVSNVARIFFDGETAACMRNSFSHKELLERLRS